MSPMSALDILDPESASSVQERLDAIRQLSNVSQALENLIVQCETTPGLQFIKQSSRHHLALVRDVLRRVIHQP